MNSSTANKTPIILVAIFLAAAGFGLYQWQQSLNRQREGVAAREKEVNRREQDAALRESKLTQAESDVEGEKRVLAQENESLDAEKLKNKRESTALDVRKKAIDSDANALEARIKAKEDEDEDQVFALNFIRTHAELRDNFYRQQLADRSAPAGGAAGAPVDPAPMPDPAMPAESQIPVGARLKLLERTAARYERVEASKPANVEEAAARMAALKELSAIDHELMMRGSPRSLETEAVMDVELEAFRDFARRAGIAEDVIPQDRFEMLTRSQLDSLETLQLQKIAFAKERNAIHPGLSELALQDEESVLKRIQNAKLKPHADPTPLFAHAVLEKKLKPEDIEALRKTTSGSAKESAIKFRLSQLMEEKLAIHWTDVGLRQHYAEMQSRLNPETAEKFRHLETASNILDLFDSWRPNDPAALKKSLRDLAKKPASIAQATQLFIQERHRDPVHAAHLQALLETAYESNMGLSAAQNQIAFKKWLAEHLTAGQIYEANLNLEGAQQVFSEVTALKLPLALHPDDQRELSEFKDAFKQEAADRPKTLGANEAQRQTAIKPSYTSDQAIYGVLRIYQTRGETPALKAALAGKALNGLASQLNLIDAAKANLELEVKQNAFAIVALERVGGSGEVPQEIESARSALSSAYTAVRLRIDELSIDLPNDSKVLDLLARVKAGLGANPPPPNVKPAQDFSDPFVAVQTQKAIPDAVGEIRAATASMRAVHERIVERQKRRIDVYGRMSCPRTTQALEIYRARGFSPTFHDIDNDYAAKAAVRSAVLKNNMLPLIKINGESINGAGEELGDVILKSCK